ncbi:MAG TPA: glycosyltransferase family 1 protein [Candidatus Binataceae bacterium]
MGQVATAWHLPDSRSLRICFVTETYPPEINGVALTLARLIGGLSARGHAISLVRPRQPGADVSRVDHNVTLVRGLPLPGYPGLQFGVPAGRLLRRLWSRSRPDAVYVATEGPLGLSAVRTARTLGIAAVSGFHTNYHSYSHYYRLGCLQSMVVRYLRSLHNQTGKTLVPSIDMRKKLHGLGFRNVGLLGRGVDSDQFGPHHRCEEVRLSWGVGRHGCAALYVGRIAPEKNLSLALDAYRAMRRVDESCKFILVGDGPMRASLQRSHPDLIFCGIKTGLELSRHFASADLFLFPSKTETFGNVTLEAMASGLGVLAYDYAAARMHITDGVTGVLAPYGDADAFVAAACRLAGDRSLVGKLGMRAREHALSVSWPRVLDSFVAHLEGVRREAVESQAAATVTPVADEYQEVVASGIERHVPTFESAPEPGV